MHDMVYVKTTYPNDPGGMFFPFNALWTTTKDQRVRNVALQPVFIRVCLSVCSINCTT